jgi:hypothetical protein
MKRANCRRRTRVLPLACHPSDAKFTVGRPQWSIAVAKRIRVHLPVHSASFDRVADLGRHDLYCDMVSECRLALPVSGIHARRQWTRCYLWDASFCAGSYRCRELLVFAARDHRPLAAMEGNCRMWSLV